MNFLSWTSGEVRWYLISHAATPLLLKLHGINIPGFFVCFVVESDPIVLRAYSWVLKITPHAWEVRETSHTTADFFKTQVGLKNSTLF